MQSPPATDVQIAAVEARFAQQDSASQFDPIGPARRSRCAASGADIAMDAPDGVHGGVVAAGPARRRRSARGRGNIEGSRHRRKSDSNGGVQLTES